VALVRVSVTVTMAPGMTAPVESVTVPRIVPRSVPWPNPAADIQNRSAKLTTHVNVTLYFKANLPCKVI